MTEPASSTNTLLLIALLGEAHDLLPAGACPYWRNEKSPEKEPQQAYRFHNHQMLDGDLEDFELYDMARVASVIEMPFYSLKFVTNVTTPEGAADFFKNLAPARKVGTCKLREFLAA